MRVGGLCQAMKAIGDSGGFAPGIDAVESKRLINFQYPENH